MWLRSRFLRKTRSEECAYPLAICKRRTTLPCAKRTSMSRELEAGLGKSMLLRKKIEQTRLIQLNCSGLFLSIGRPQGRYAPRIKRSLKIRDRPRQLVRRLRSFKRSARCEHALHLSEVVRIVR